MVSHLQSTFRNSYYFAFFQTFSLFLQAYYSANLFPNSEFQTIKFSHTYIFFYFIFAPFFFRSMSPTDVIIYKYLRNYGRKLRSSLYFHNNKHKSSSACSAVGRWLVLYLWKQESKVKIIDYKCPSLVNLPYNYSQMASCLLYIGIV